MRTILAIGSIDFVSAVSELNLIAKLAVVGNCIGSHFLSRMSHESANFHQRTFADSLPLVDPAKTVCARERVPTQWIVSRYDPVLPSGFGSRAEWMDD
jgi:hypothetical protein